jgi:hypothetical protein
MKVKMFFLVAFSICALFVSTNNCFAQNDKRKFLSSTKRLPAIDKVEIIKLHKSPEEQNAPSDVVGTSFVKGKKAKRIAAVWRKLKWNFEGQAACHEPGYRVKFYSKGKLLVYANVCWSCNNVSFVAPEGINAQPTFDGYSPRGEALEELFAREFRDKEKQN